MTKSNKFFDDLSQLAGSAAGLMNDLQKQMRAEIKSRVDETATRLDLVPREDFEALEARLDKMLDDQKNLEQRVKTLEEKSK